MEQSASSRSSLDRDRLPNYENREQSNQRVNWFAAFRRRQPQHSQNTNEGYQSQYSSPRRRASRQKPVHRRDWRPSNERCNREPRRSTPTASGSGCRFVVFCPHAGRPRTPRCTQRRPDESESIIHVPIPTPSVPQIARSGIADLPCISKNTMLTKPALRQSMPKSALRRPRPWIARTTVLRSG